MTEAEYVRFLKRVRMRLNNVAADCCNGLTERASEGAFALIRDVHAEISRVEMGSEREAVGALSLADLPAPGERDLDDELEGLGE